MKQGSMFFASLAGTLLLTMPLVALAQGNRPDPSDAPAAASTAPTTGSGTQAAAQLGEVTVTATRRRRNIDSVPVAVTEISGKTLQQNVLRDTQALVMESPSLNITVSGSENVGGVIRMRGIGTTGNNPGLESSVGVFIDGLYVPRPALALGELFDISRVEVLRGPQSTLFGKNTAVGAINIRTNKPTFEPESLLDLSLGNRNGTIATSVVNAPINDRFALRLSGRYNVRDGYIHNITDNQNYDNRNRYALRAQALYWPTDQVSLRLIGDFIHKNERCCAAPYTINGPASAKITALGGTVFNPPQDYTTAFNSEVKSTSRQYRVSGHLHWYLDQAEVRAILGYQYGSGNDAADADYNDLDLVTRPYLQPRIRERTAEINIHGKRGPLDWLAGVYFANEDINVSDSLLFGDQAGQFILYGTPLEPAASTFYPAGSGQPNSFATQNSNNWSIFTHNILDLGAGFNLTLGGRYAIEHKRGGGVSPTTVPACNLPSPLPAAARLLCGALPYQADYADHRFTGTVALSKNIGVGSTYISYSSGFKSGGIDLTPSDTVAISVNPLTGQTVYTPGPTTFRPEKVDSYEIGLKLPMLGGRLTTRTAVFFMNIRDFQVSGFNGTYFTVFNASRVFSRGFEFESRYLVTPHLNFSAGATYAYDTYGQHVQPVSLQGQMVNGAPHWVGQLGAGYSHALPFWSARLFSNAVARYQTSTNAGVFPDPNKVQGGYALLNARIGLKLPENWEVSLWGANLTNSHYNLILFDGVAQPGSINGYPGEPRTWGFEMRKWFF